MGGMRDNRSTRGDWGRSVCSVCVWPRIKTNMYNCINEAIRSSFYVAVVVVAVRCAGRYRTYRVASDLEQSKCISGLLGVE